MSFLLLFIYLPCCLGQDTVKWQFAFFEPNCQPLDRHSATYLALGHKRRTRLVDFHTISTSLMLNFKQE